MGDQSRSKARPSRAREQVSPRRLTLTHQIGLVGFVALALFCAWAWLDLTARAELDALLVERATIATNKDSLARLGTALGRARLDESQLVSTRRAESLERFGEHSASFYAELRELERELEGGPVAAPLASLGEGFRSYEKAVVDVNRLQRRLGLGFGETEGEAPQLAVLARALAEELHAAELIPLELEVTKLELHAREFAANLDMRVADALLGDADALLASLPEGVEVSTREYLQGYRSGLSRLTTSVLELELAVSHASLKFGQLGPHQAAARGQLDRAGESVERGIKAQREASARQSAALFGCTFLFTVGFLLSQIRNAQGFARRVRELAGVMEHVADGDFINLAKLERVSSEVHDEIGVLSREFNRMLDVFEELAGAARAVTAGDLRVEIVSEGELQDAFRAMITELRATVSKTREAATTIAAAATEINDASLGQEQAANYQAEGIREVSVAMQRLADAAGDISHSASEVLDNALQTRERADGLVANFSELEEHMDRIGALSQLIREISDRSDLLALNGSLEATRAGEAGRGFALVAAEMRRLAERVKGTTAGIREAVRDIDVSTAKTAEATTDSRLLATHTSKAAEHIVALTEAQGRETATVSAGVADIATVLESSVAVTSETRMAAAELQYQADGLRALMQGFELGEQAKQPAS